MKSIFWMIPALFPILASGMAPGPLNQAESTKKNRYVSDSLVSGGDSEADAFRLQGFRWAKNPAGYERLVFDLGSDAGGPEAKAPPYFQVGHNSRSRSIQLSIRGIAGRGVSTSSLGRSIRSSGLLASAYLAPELEGDLAALEFKTRGDVDIESFYLLNPPRIVIDVRARP